MSTGTEQYGKKIEDFFTYLEKQEYGEGIDFLYSENPWILSKADDIKKLRTQFEGLPEIVGKYLEHALNIEEKVSGRLVCLDYFVAFERQPLRFSFQFYRAKDTWVTHSFEYRDDIDEWVKEKAKIRFTGGEIGGEMFNPPGISLWVQRTAKELPLRRAGE